MVIRWTNKTKTVQEYWGNEPGHYGIPYPCNNYYPADEGVEVQLSSWDQDGLTLARLKGLEDGGHGRLVWVTRTK